MKLDHLEMLDAFERRDITAMLRVVWQHYSLELPKLEIVSSDIKIIKVTNRDRYEMRMDLDGISYVWRGKFKFYYPYPADTSVNCSRCYVWW